MYTLHSKTIELSKETSQQWSEREDRLSSKEQKLD